MERNAGRAGDRGSVNAKRLVQWEEQQHRVDDITGDRGVGRARARQGGEYDEGAGDQQGGGQKGAEQGGGHGKRV